MTVSSRLPGISDFLALTGIEPAMISASDWG
jgi:hypothetical protein